MGLLLTPEQSRGARRKLGFTQADVIQKGGLSAYKLKQFESGFADPEGITPFLKQLRSFYEDNGVGFGGKGATKRPSEGGESDSEDSFPAGRPVRVQREAMFLCPRLSENEKEAIHARIGENRDSLRKLAATKIKSGLLDPLSTETEGARDQALELLKEQGALYGILFGQCAFATPAPELIADRKQVKTVGDLLALSLATMFEESGLLDAAISSQDDPELEEEEAQG